MESKESRRFVILPVDVTKAGQIISLDRELPAHLMVCKGINATVKGFLNTGKDIQHMGEISILFNSGQLHPFHQTVGYSIEPLRKKNNFFELKEPLVPNYRITGFYEDAGNSRDIKGNFLPYSVNIYLDCKAKV
ncbi:MAG: hypothetical protein HY951_07060 [Bacteroidia bacterium]|nr:hypothetical protein [Bacteroidia bacterium]